MGYDRFSVKTRSKEPWIKCEMIVSVIKIGNTGIDDALKNGSGLHG